MAKELPLAFSEVARMVEFWMPPPAPRALATLALAETAESKGPKSVAASESASFVGNAMRLLVRL